MRRCGDAWDEARILRVDDGDRRCDCVRRHFDGFEDGFRRGLHLACPRRAHVHRPTIAPTSHFNDPLIDIDEMRTTPVPHRYVHGGFAGTGFPDFGGTPAEFAFYFPPAEQYQGRFIQGPTHQLTPNENLGNNQIAFAIASGAYAVQTNMGGSEAATFTEAVLFFGFDPEIVGYRVNAAAAKYSREVAAEMYGPHRPYGYLFGGSGGAYQTISSAENTTVWDGYVPFVLGNENSIPTAYTRADPRPAHSRAERQVPVHPGRGRPGWKRRPARLLRSDRGAGRGATRKQRAWDSRRVAGSAPRWRAPGPSRSSPATCRSWTSSYTDDFWTLPGYLGHDDPYGSLATARIIHNTTVVDEVDGPEPARLASFPPASALTAIDLRILSGAGTGASQVGLPPGFVRAPATNAGALTVTIPAFAVAIYNAVVVGDQVALDNSGYLALQTYQRHQIGGAGAGLLHLRPVPRPAGARRDPDLPAARRPDRAGRPVQRVRRQHHRRLPRQDDPPAVVDGPRRPPLGRRLVQEKGGDVPGQGSTTDSGSTSRTMPSMAREQRAERRRGPSPTTARCSTRCATWPLGSSRA